MKEKYNEKKKVIDHKWQPGAVIACGFWSI